LGSPKSLGGLADRAGVEIEGDEEVADSDQEVDTMDSLRERTEEWTEDIEERESVLVDENDAEEEIQQMQKETES
jgi:Ser-tRNA(Ala) deacylase AlaX